MVIRVLILILVSQIMISCTKEKENEKDDFYSFIRLKSGSNWGSLYHMYELQSRDTIQVIMIEYFQQMREIRNKLMIEKYKGVNAEGTKLLNPVPDVNMFDFLESNNFYKMSKNLYKALKSSGRYKSMQFLLEEAVIEPTSILSKDNIEKLEVVETDLVLMNLGSRVFILLLQDNCGKEKYS
jgi:hypothetical protein